MATTQKANACSSWTSCYKLRQMFLQIRGTQLLQIRAIVITNCKGYYKLGQMILGQLLEIGQENIYGVYNRKTYDKLIDNSKHKTILKFSMRFFTRYHLILHKSMNIL